MSKNYTHRFCQLCRAPSRWAVCDSCFAIEVPCPRCQRPMRQYLRSKQLREACTPCLRLKDGHTIRYGTAVCRICGQRHAPRPGSNSRTCEKCLSISVPCPVCSEPMPRYTTKAKERQFCSERCKFRHNCLSPEGLQKASRARWPDENRKTSTAVRLRTNTAYERWRSAVFHRDGYTCQRCGARNGQGRTVFLHAHHILPFSKNPEGRYDPDNGTTMCEDCHTLEHGRPFPPQVFRPCQVCGVRTKRKWGICRDCAAASSSDAASGPSGLVAPL